MEPDHRIRTKFCNNCKCWIKIMHFDVHLTRCKSLSNPPSFRQRGIDIKKTIQSIAKKENPYLKMPQNEEELFPCCLCGFSQTILDLDTHPRQCPSRQMKCCFCQFLFPTYLIKDHEAICPQKHRTRPLPSELSGHPQVNKLPQDIDDIQISEINQDSPRNRDEIDLQQIEDRREVIQIHERIQELASRKSEDMSGLKEQEIAKIKDRKFKKQEPQKCSICYCQFFDNDLIKDLPCKHIYHSQCISKWLLKNPSCPMCKLNISKSIDTSESKEKKESQDKKQPFYRKIFQRFTSWWTESHSIKGSQEVNQRK